ncbi:alpha/beta hydrolase [Kitasatospora acidiphila]|uniref:Alpha/beta hydrolase n=1 Tax=Kitasatospora acidiphila TaxID=2567942 RepID=A0A540W9A8_9ACTN|nr:alpha/beta hydrolase [Kitasatospora acidiphila]TQF05609.1 alpha/beta hydrolase [Kitasatospora acidiphila]
MRREPVRVTVWQDGTAATDRVLLVHGTLSWGTDCFREQRPLATEFRLELMDRRGFGASPDIEHSDYEVDAEDIAELLGGGAHLVGHSYGAAGALLAAAQLPGSIRSLALIEPSVLHTAEDDVPQIAAALKRIRAAFGEQLEPMSPEEYLCYSTDDYGLPRPEFTPELLRAAASAMAERPAWDAMIPLAPIRAADYPKLVVNGSWETAAPDYRAFIGEALLACGAFVAERIGARRVLVPGAVHAPHQEQPEVVNGLLAELWA